MMQRIVFGRRGPCLRISSRSPDINCALRSRFDTPIDRDCRTNRITSSFSLSLLPVYLFFFICSCHACAQTTTSSVNTRLDSLFLPPLYLYYVHTIDVVHVIFLGEKTATCFTHPRTNVRFSLLPPSSCVRYRKLCFCVSLRNSWILCGIDYPNI